MGPFLDFSDNSGQNERFWAEILNRSFYFPNRLLQSSRRANFFFKHMTLGGYAKSGAESGIKLNRFRYRKNIIKHIVMHHDAPHTYLESAWVGFVRKNSLFDGKTLSTLPRRHLPPRVFLPRSCSSFLTRRGRQGTRGDNNNTTTRCRCPEAPCHHHAQGDMVNPFR